MYSTVTGWYTSLPTWLKLTIGAAGTAVGVAVMAACGTTAAVIAGAVLTAVVVPTVVGGLVSLGVSSAVAIYQMLAGQRTEYTMAEAWQAFSGGIVDSFGLAGATFGVAQAVSSAGRMLKTGNANSNYGANNAADGARLKEYYRKSEKYGNGSVKELNDGRYRFYEQLNPAKTHGEMAGGRYVREWHPSTGQTRGWHETLDHFGNIRQVRPDTNVTNGVKVHYMFDASGNYIGKR